MKDTTEGALEALGWVLTLPVTGRVKIEVQSAMNDLLRDAGQTFRIRIS